MTVLKCGLGVSLELFYGPAFRFVSAQKNSVRRVPIKVGLEITLMSVLMKTVNQRIDSSLLIISHAHRRK